MSFVADLRQAIDGFHFADNRLSQLPTLTICKQLKSHSQSQTTLFLPLKRNLRIERNV